VPQPSLQSTVDLRIKQQPLPIRQMMIVNQRIASK